MRRTIIAGAALTASLAFAASAQADSVSVDGFKGFTEGNVNGQFGWSSSGDYDQRIVDVKGDKKLRISNARTSGAFADMTFSNPVHNPASEINANNVLVNEFTFQAPQNYVPGLALTISPDDGHGGRMSRVRLEDSEAGVKVTFADSTFEDQLLATVSREGVHSIKIETTFVKGDDNDVVRIFIDGNLAIRGGSWENYYREWEERNPGAVDRLIIRTAGIAAPATLGGGFLIDDVTSTSSHVDNPAPLHPVVLPQGPKGETGDAGAKGEQGPKGEPGATVLIPSAPLGATVSTLHGNTLRTIHAPKLKDMKFVSVKASLRGKRLSVKGRAVKVDLRSRPAGNYDVQMTAKYRKRGNLVTVRSLRTLKVTL
jgi:hypothetical protein